MEINNRKKLDRVLSLEFRCYFISLRYYVRCMLLQEHEYYLWKYQRLLRWEEYYKCRGLVFFRAIVRKKRNSLGAKLGILINPLCFEEGLHIWHYGNIIVNGYAKIGKGCILHGNNCIGNKGDISDKAPVIGNNVDIGVGASVIGDVYIADDIKIGAGAVVVSSFYEKGITICGVPARKVERY